ncbi:hypothetical protein RIU82_10900 [Enterobacter soli]|nr:hypothetical protein [Enterobacter soli]
MEDIYFYQPDGHFKYINKCSLWVISRLVDIVTEKREVRKWMEPMWMKAHNQEGIAVYVSRIDAEIVVHQLKKRDENWGIYPLNDFNITEMMLDCKKNTNQDRYNFIFSIGFWLNNHGALISNNYVLSQALTAEGFVVDSQFNKNEKVIIRFSEKNLKFIHHCWEGRVNSQGKYDEYLARINEMTAENAANEALKALKHIQVHEKNGDISEIATIWSVDDQEWVMSNLNNIVN